MKKIFLLIALGASNAAHAGVTNEKSGETKCLFDWSEAYANCSICSEPNSPALTQCMSQANLAYQSCMDRLDEFHDFLRERYGVELAPSPFMF